MLHPLILLKEVKFNIDMLLRNYSFLVSLANLNTEQDFIGACVFDFPNLASQCMKPLTSVSSEADTDMPAEPVHPLLNQYLDLQIALGNDVTSTAELF
jgi:hypothetical protein